MDVYEQQIINDVEALREGCYFDMGNIDKYPKELACQILKKLLEWACQPQNTTPIVIARNKISEINKEWLLKNLIEVAVECIDMYDEWEYRRLAEVVVGVIPELKQEVLEFGVESENEEIREVVEDFLMM